MEYELKHRPTNTIASVTLEPNEQLTSEAGALVSHTDTISMSTQTGDSEEGLLESVKDSLLGGESLFRNTFVADGGQGVVDLAPTKPGDMDTVELDQQELYIQAGSYVAASEGVSLDSELGNLDTLLGGEGIALLKAHGAGTLFLGSYGGIERRELAADERFTVDSGHVVAWDATMEYNTERVGGYKETLLSGEGLVMRFDGPGTVFLQTRNYQDFLDEIVERIPTNDGGGGNIQVG
jgi:uncharacterized protein (TIGR00266 family)